MRPNADIEDAVDSTVWIDTHEHLFEESQRLNGPTGGILHTCDDWALLFLHYATDDLVSAGMSAEELIRFSSTDVGPVDKWDLAAEFIQRCRFTGYVRAALLSIERLFGLALDRGTCEEVTRRLRDGVQPGYYGRVLRDVAKVDSCQVNSLGAMFCETEYPDLLLQDIGIPALCLATPEVVAGLEEMFDADVTGFDGYLRLVDAVFDRWGDRAVAVKSQWAYMRRLSVDVVDEADAQRVYEKRAAGHDITGAERKALEDHLFGYCVQRATERRLPVKLHTGYYAGTGQMPLHRVRDNMPDLCGILTRYPDTTFVLMHIGYPYQHEAIAVAKHYPNAVIDLCWAWIIDPVSSTQFVRSFLATAPWSKLLCFGGDYTCVENIVGHAEIGRRGLARALSMAVDDGTLTAQDAVHLVPELMRGNADRVFPVARLVGAPH